MPVNLCYTQKVRGFQQEKVKYSKESAEIHLEQLQSGHYCSNIEFCYIQRFYRDKTTPLPQQMEQVGEFYSIGQVLEKVSKIAPIFLVWKNC